MFQGQRRLIVTQRNCTLFATTSTSTQVAV